MAESDNEEQLLQYITETRWRTSLASIREAMEDIWASTDALRIIHDFTDHGPLHSKRLIAYTSKLLTANYGKSLSSDEAYVLLAGIYLHDIGMQCDVIKYPAIKARAEELGAQFDIEFTAITSGGYSIDEQKSIRKNHQYLAAAWIDYAYKTGDTVLGAAIKTVPENFVIDLMDVCKFHSKLSINDCPVYFRFDPNDRKQLIAALLRFSDELDIDANRVSIDTVKTFRLDPYNSIYWWLHSRTKISFIPPTLILYSIRLHPQDMMYSTRIYSEFIIGFQTKNQSVLSILAQNGIPFMIHPDSKVEVDEYVERLPTEIINALQSMQKSDNSLASITDQLHIMHKFTEATSEINQLNIQGFWERVDSVLDLWRDKLDVEYIAFFSGETEKDTILTLKTSAGLLPPRTSTNISMPHFNWRKAGLNINDGSDTYRDTKDWSSVSLSDRELLRKGFRGESDPFSSCTGLIPTGLPHGPFGLMIIGNQLSTTNATVPEQIVLTISRDLSIQLLLLYLVQILRSERATRENVSELMAHRIRSSLQGISSQLKVLDSERKDQLGFTSEDRKRAKLYLEDTFRQLTQLSLVPHSGIRLFDVKSAIREFVPLGDIIWDACADFQDFANYQDIKIEVSDTVSRLPLVYVNRTLMRLAIATLIDNGIKNSSPPPKGKGGSIQINTNNGLAERGASVKVVSYGIGIKGIDLERVFEWNTRLAYSPHHKNATGLGAGLWEVKYIVEGHGGHISASSVHYSGEPITNENISQCVTTFTVTLPVGKGS